MHSILPAGKLEFETSGGLNQTTGPDYLVSLSCAFFATSRRYRQAAGLQPHGLP